MASTMALTPETRALLVCCLRVAAEQFAKDRRTMQMGADGTGDDAFASVADQFAKQERQARQLADELEDY